MLLKYKIFNKPFICNGQSRDLKPSRTRPETFETEQTRKNVSITAD